MMKTKIKRKDLDQFNDDFSDFSLSSPARKIPRLDVELPPIMEEDEHSEIGVLHGEQMEGRRVIGLRELGVSDSVPNCVNGQDLPVCENRERAIVLFKTVNTPLLQFSVDSNIISGFKNQFLRTASCGGLDSIKDEDESNGSGCLAVVPWVPSQVPLGSTAEVSLMETAELMEAEEMGEAAMDIEDTNFSVSDEQGQQQAHQYVTQWHQQQHCMIPQLPENTSTPITWYR